MKAIDRKAREVHGQVLLHAETPTEQIVAMRQVNVEAWKEALMIHSQATVGFNRQIFPIP